MEHRRGVPEPKDTRASKKIPICGRGRNARSGVRGEGEDTSVAGMSQNKVGGRHGKDRQTVGKRK